MTAEDRQRWDQRYREQASAPAVAMPGGLEGFVHLLPSGGRALDVACGGGAGSVWLASLGFDVVGVDVSPVAVDRARALAATAGLSHRCRFETFDLDEGLPSTDPVDLVLCHRFNAPALDRPLLERLAVGGRLVVTVLSEVGAEAGPFRVPAGDLLARFAGLDVLGHREGGGEATIIVGGTGPETVGRLD